MPNTTRPSNRDNASHIRHNPVADRYQGFAEVVVSVSDFGQVSALTQAGGWEVLHNGPGAPELSRLWSLEPLTRSRARIDEQVLHVPGMGYGFLRFTCIGDVAQQPIRPADAHPWETGGLWLIYTRSEDGYALSRELTKAGWPTVRGVHGFDFGDLAVNEVHHQGPDGMVLSIIEQQKPPLTVPSTGLSHAFNAAIVVRDFNQSREFFVDKLGFKPWMDVVWDGNNPGLTLLADLEAFTGVNAIKTTIVHPEGENRGSVELIGWDGAPRGRDFTDQANPPNLGSVALRFGVADLDAHLARLGEQGVEPVQPAINLTLAPYGLVRMAPIRSPDGVWLEFFEVLAQ
ncbi:MAG: hypothetical protein R3F24_11085 [Gammaproteobacteria bacterium]